MKKGFITSILTVLAITGMQAQSLQETPKLVVSLTIDQLRTDYLEAFSALYGEKGFKRLWKEGKFFKNLEYQFANPDRSSAIASIYTGTTPSIHGIIGNYWMDASIQQVKSCVDDPAFMGNSTNDSSSPALLGASTISDELQIATKKKGLVYAVSPFRDAAILTAGHSANGAFWMDELTGKWCSTTYYPEFPWWINEYNDWNNIEQRLDTLNWKPVYPKNKYIYLPEWRDQAFKHNLGKAKAYKIRQYMSTPFINEEVNDIVKELINQSALGQDGITDLLSMVYYAGNYMHKSPQECAMEIQDAYVRLDKTIANLLDILDKKVGLNNVLLSIQSTGYADSETSDHGLYHIPGGEFYLNRCSALLNMFLMATYGEGQYVQAQHNQQIYLDHALIEKKNLNLADIQYKSAEFLLQFSGVNEVYSAPRLFLGNWSPEIELIKNGFHRKNSGDILVNILPGWTIVNEENPRLNRVVRSGYLPTPLFFFGYTIKPETINTPVKASKIAPTLTSVMRIRSPNASTEMKINL